MSAPQWPGSAGDTQPTRTGPCTVLEVSRKLGSLAETLSGMGFRAYVTDAGRYAGVSVTNMTMPQHAKAVYAAPTDDGWWFWWSWAERIARVDDVEAAAVKIAATLMPTPDE